MDKRSSGKKHLKLIDRYESDDYSRYAEPDYSDETFELGEQDFHHSRHEDKDRIKVRSEGNWTNPGVSGKNDSGEIWVNDKEYKKQANFIGYGPRGYKRSDDRIYEEVCEVLMRNPDVNATNIGVKVENGVVFLSGKVESRRMKKIAEMIIDDLPGIQDVKNELTTFRKEEDSGPDAAAKKDLGINQ